MSIDVRECKDAAQGGREELRQALHTRAEDDKRQKEELWKKDKVIRNLEKD